MEDDAPHISVGKAGETAAERYLARNGFTILDRNFQRKWGEVDIIAEKGDTIHFVEVKSVSREKRADAVSHETWRPEEQVHHKKLQKMARTAQLWLQEFSCEKEWQLDVIAVTLYTQDRSGTIKYIPHVVFE